MYDLLNKKWLVKQFCGVLLAAFFLCACKAHYQAASMQYQQFRIEEGAPQDTALAAMIRPYADSVHRTMSQVIGVVAVDLEKKQPEGNLGNLMADACRAEAERIYGKKIDAAFVNYGGIRVTQVPAGPLTLNKVFEMMPFDNLLVVQEVPGQVLQLFLDNVAARGGWPGSGIQYTIRNKKATEVLIGGQPLEAGRKYTIANSDYVANGGDDSDMLRAIPQENKGFLVRDGLIHYFSSLAAKGQPIGAAVENRVRNAN